MQLVQRGGTHPHPVTDALLRQKHGLRTPEDVERSYEDAAEVEAAILLTKGLQGGWWPQKPGERRRDSSQHLLKELLSTPQSRGLPPGTGEKQSPLLSCGRWFCYTALGKHSLLGSPGEGQDKASSEPPNLILQTLIQAQEACSRGVQKSSYPGCYRVPVILQGLSLWR